MDNLYCEEEWLPISPVVEAGNDVGNGNENEGGVSKEQCKEDSLETIRLFIGKEESYMPRPDYSRFLASDQFVSNNRIKSLLWLFRTQSRLNLSAATLFGAINNLDRYLDKTNIHLWLGSKDRMFELLTVACLSVACKFNDQACPRLEDLQIVKMDYPSNTPSLVQKMELSLLDILGWKMDCVTPFSYVELMIQSIDFDNMTNDHFDVDDFTFRVTDLLVTAVLDAKALQFRPSIIAASALQCVLGDMPGSDSTDYKSVIHQCLSSINPQCHKDGLIKCHKIVYHLYKKFHFNMLSCANAWLGPESPVTVLKVNDRCVEGSSRKRKREQLEY